MLEFPDLKVGLLIIIDGQPYEIMEAHHSKVAQRRAVLQTRIKNLITGAVLNKNITHMEKFEEAEIERKKVKYLYNNKGEYWFCDPDKPSDRFNLVEQSLGNTGKFLKPNSIIESFIFNEKIISIKPPIKENFVVVDSPPGVKGDSAQGATKTVKIESGASVTVPLFIEQGDIITVNTDTGLYVSRAEKNK